jgi:phosphatidylserine/phosphatidylglycerophosphate/cardiolipin synthase-like enzyme
MAAVALKAYLSPSLVLLAFDWVDGGGRADFVGFALRRTPGFRDFVTGQVAPSSWLPNRLSFSGPPAEGQPDFDSDDAPIQKFMWWDARLEGVEPGESLTYEAFPVTGRPGALSVLTAHGSSLTVALPPHREHGIGTWFNRAVMGSQAFSRKVDALRIKPGRKPTAAQAAKLRAWLANGIESPLPELIDAAPDSVVGAIYHLSDTLWIVPALKAAMARKDIALVYDAKVEKDADGRAKPNPSDAAIATLARVTFARRDKANIMHNKFLVAGRRLRKSNPAPRSLACGSANYTTDGLTSQANLVHTFDSPALARLYLARFRLLAGNPTLAKTKRESGWSNTVSVGDAGVRVFFSPEPGDAGDDSAAIETVVQAIHAARSSVVFCLFTPTDQALRDACFAVGDAGKMMFGLVNRVAKEEPGLTATASGRIPADQLAALEIYHRSRNARDTIGAEFFSARDVPAGFVRELNVFPGTRPPGYPPVTIHHKFVAVDAETDSPVIYTGSANMSGNSAFRNDENLLEIRGSPRLAQIYLAEFLRLYEHYRARARFIEWKRSGRAPSDAGFALRPNAGWAAKHYTPGTPEFKARVRMLSVA